MNEEIYEKFALWWKKAHEISSLEYPNATFLATSDINNQPDGRIVLIKNHSRDGLVFFTNKISKKGTDLAHNNKAAACFYWDILGLQIRIQGSVFELDEQLSVDYFNTRPLESKIGAIASKQSQKMGYENEFLDRFNELKSTVSDPQKPPYWGGYILKPHRVEFWQEVQFRLHNRDLYEKNEAGEWLKSKLFP
jgi:pyridoxamine 5'-phosphate oxidase